MTNHIFPSEGLLNATQNLPNGEVKAETRLSLTGDHAHRQIFSWLQGYPAAQLLSREVYDFYGNYLSYIESKDFTSTLFTIDLQHDSIALKSADIELQLGTGRVAEALTHELLHLHLPILGFPLGELVRVPLWFDHYAQTFLGMCNWVVNAVHHEINFERFVALGFDKKLFLAKHGTPMDYRRLFKPDPQNMHTRLDDFSRWCIKYTRHLLNARHGGSEDHLQYAQEALDWGSRLHPELKQTAAEIDRWFETGAFKDPHQYPRQVNSLLDLMRIPKFTGWVILKISESKKPIAIRLDANGSVLPHPDRMMEAQKENHLFCWH